MDSHRNRQHDMLCDRRRQNQNVLPQDIPNGKSITRYSWNATDSSSLSCRAENMKATDMYSWVRGCMTATFRISIIMPHGPAFPPRGKEAMTGSRFRRLTEKLNASERDSIILREIVAGNIPGWLRKPVYLTDTIADAAGKTHEVIWRVLPDFIAIGNDSDFMRVPMLPLTAQKIADHFGSRTPNSPYV